MNITYAIELLKYYDGPLGLTLHSGADANKIAEVETALKINLPEDFKIFYSFSDGFETEEDIFNMIPLSEIIDNKDDELNIAEYMIYSDMWELKINPQNPDDYGIYFHETLLTKSLAEFIERFLLGGVFERYGLYFWFSETRARINGPTKPENVLPLISMYYYGLVHGIFSKKEVIEWSDYIIDTENEPDYFFIALSSTTNTEGIISILKEALPDIDKDVITIRALFSQLDTQLIINRITEEEALAKIFRISDYISLSNYEEVTLFRFKEYELINANVEKVIKDFLGLYGIFHVSFYEQWGAINEEFEKNLSSRNVPSHFEYLEANQPPKSRNSLNKHFMAAMVIAGLLATFITINYLGYRKGLFKTFNGIALVALNLTFYLTMFGYTLIKHIYRKD